MRIAFIVTSFPSLSATFILDQITALLDRGHDVTIYADRPGRDDVIHPEVAQYGLLHRSRIGAMPRNLVWRALKGTAGLAAHSRTSDTRRHPRPLRSKRAQGRLSP